MLQSIENFLQTTGIAKMFSADATTPWWKYLIMYAIVGVLFYLAIVKKFEPLLLLPIAFGMLLANLPGANLIHLDFFFDEYYIGFNGINECVGTLRGEWQGFAEAIAEKFGDSTVFTIKDGVCTIAGEYLDKDKNEALYNSFMQIFNEHLGSYCKINNGIVQVKMITVISEVINNGGLIDILYLGVKLGIYPSLIFMGVGAMTDFSPLISNPKSLLMGAGAQLGVFVAFFGALLLGFSPKAAGAIGIIGGADGPTAILVTKELAPELLGAIAIAAYSYMALIPIIQPPFMRLLTTKKERQIKMTNLRPVSKVEKVIFPIIVTLLVTLLVPDAAPLVGFLMLGNLFNVTGVTDRLSKTAQNELCNIITIMLGVSVGATASADRFLDLNTIKIIGLGLAAFIVSTCGGLIVGKIMCFVTKGKINPLIGAAGVSAVPMAARVAQDEGRKADPSNFLLMHAMGPNVAGVIGSAVAAGIFLSLLR